ncbi:hypothetical protein MJG53_014104 [Ovis ammon polii x Ovis aries]|uniref:Uncharacterized protein n=1 Tax=Ovis ammon polii x Ovis aries TaxID=2918886 RepID=A0ACB9UKF3_9CETA|nr:hypothetical protein MJG53_014104 [Ovis ammon polii x Ovis aries]
MTCSDTKELSGASSWVQAAFIRKGRTRDTSSELLNANRPKEAECLITGVNVTISTLVSNNGKQWAMRPEVHLGTGQPGPLHSLGIRPSLRCYAGPIIQENVPPAHEKLVIKRENRRHDFSHQVTSEETEHPKDQIFARSEVSPFLISDLKDECSRSKEFTAFGMDCEKPKSLPARQLPELDSFSS